MLPAFPALRDRPIPDLTLRKTPQGYRDIPIDRTSARSSEPLLPLAHFGVKGRSYYAHSRNPPYWQAAPGAVDNIHVRAGMGALLETVDNRLKAEGLRLHVFDAWRPRAVQAYYFEQWLPGELRKRRPDLSPDALDEERERYWARPTIDDNRPAPHATGGAVDLTLAWEDGEPLFMGSMFDDPSVISATDHFERETPGAWSVSAEEARANRRVLYWVMIEAGFCNYAVEWWHFSYGDQMWARLTGQAVALYGLAAPPPGFADG